MVSCKWFLYEEGYIDKEAGRFRAHEFVADARSDFGAMDEVILWQGYPRLGLDSPEKSTLGVKAPSTKIG